MSNHPFTSAPDTFIKFIDHCDCNKVHQPIRPTWEEHAMGLAQVALRRSVDPHRKVGACALGYDNRVLDVAYNGLAPGKEVPDSFWEDRDARRPFMLHAEANLLARVTIGNVRLLACTLLPCASCATMIAAYKIPEVVFMDLYTDTSAFEIFKFYNITCRQIKSQLA